MPGRLLREGILDSEPVNALSWAGEVFYRRLMSAVDDYGRFDGRPAVLRSRLYPLKLAGVSEADVSSWLAECQRAGLVSRYSVAGKPYLLFHKLGTARAKESKYPAPPDTGCVQTHADANGCVQTHADANGCVQTHADAPYSYSGADSGSGSGAGASEKPAPLPRHDARIPTNPDPGSVIRPPAFGEFAAAWFAAGLPPRAGPPGATHRRRGWWDVQVRDDHFRANWRAAVERAGRSRLCRGEIPDKQFFTVDFFLEKPDQVVKVLEGQYDDAATGGAAAAPDPVAAAIARRRAERTAPDGG